jgi:Uma2 family endonuclease
MTMRAGATLITNEEFLELADNEQFERWLIRGVLRERPSTARGPTHAGTTAAITGFLGQWLLTRPEPRPKLYNGDIYFRLRRDPETNVGVDVALATPEQAKVVKLYDRLIEGPPLLATEVLSASDTTEDIHEKVREFLTAGTALVWIIDPYDFTVTVHRPGEEPVLYNRNQELIGDPVLPGFRVRVAALFQ